MKTHYRLGQVTNFLGNAVSGYVVTYCSRIVPTERTVAEGRPDDVCLTCERSYLGNMRRVFPPDDAPALGEYGL